MSSAGFLRLKARASVVAPLCVRARCHFCAWLLSLSASALASRASTRTCPVDAVPRAYLHPCLRFVRPSSMNATLGARRPSRAQVQPRSSISHSTSLSAPSEVLFSSRAPSNQSTCALCQGVPRVLSSEKCPAVAARTHACVSRRRRQRTRHQRQRRTSWPTRPLSSERDPSTEKNMWICRAHGLDHQRDRRRALSCAVELVCR